MPPNLQQSFEDVVQPVVSDVTGGVTTVITTADALATQIESSLGSALTQLGASLDDLRALPTDAADALLALLKKLDEVKSRNGDVASFYAQLQTQTSWTERSSMLRQLYTAMQDVNQGLGKLFALLRKFLDTVPDLKATLRDSILGVDPHLSRWL